jgi:hypothetical protein
MRVVSVLLIGIVVRISGITVSAKTSVDNKNDTNNAFGFVIDHNRI